MKKNRKLALALAAVVSLGAFAQQSQTLQDGFYRVQNCFSNRYAYVYDEEPRDVNWQATDIDLSDIMLYSTQKRNPLSDPASVIYVNKVSNKHNLHCQNTSFYGFIGHYVQIQDGPKKNGKFTYKITPLKAGTSYYAYDQAGILKGENSPTFSDKHYFYFNHFDANGDEYLGIAPKEEMKVGAKYYKPYVIGFDMTLLSPGMKAYYVSGVKEDAVIIKEISGPIPYNTPVIIECSSTDPSNNRVDVSITKSARIDDNELTGNYFSFEDHSTSKSAYTVYNPQTMRVLKVKDGKLVFGSVADGDEVSTTRLAFAYVVNNEQQYTYKQCLQGNSSYLKVAADFPDNVPVMTEEEYNATHGVVPGDADGNGCVNVSDVNGNGGIVQMVLNRTAENLSTADLNKDGKVTIVDIALLIKRLISNK